MKTENLIDTGEAATILGVTRRHVRHLIAIGRLPKVEFGRDLFLPRRAVEKYKGPRRKRKHVGANGISPKG